MDTTYVNRANTNEVVYKAANDKLKEEGKNKEVVSFKKTYEKLKRKRAIRILKRKHTPIYKITFDGNKLRKWIHPNRRVGRPRMNWTEETIKEIWQFLKQDDNRYKYVAFDGNNETHIKYIEEKVQNI